MKIPDENKLAAYIDGKLAKKEMEKIDKIVAGNKELQNTILDVLNAKRSVNKDSNKELPWQLKSLMESGLEKQFANKAKLILKLLKNGIEEITNTLTGAGKTLAYNVRNVAQNTPVFHYMHKHNELTFDIYTYFEDENHISIKLEVKDPDEVPVEGNISFKRIGDGVEKKATQDGAASFEKVKRGDYEFRFEYEDVLAPENKPNNVYIFLALD
mgnify:CR=1 FL=1